MKKSTKTLLIVAAALILAGILLGFIEWGILDKNLENLNRAEERVIQQETFDPDFEQIILDMGCYDVQIDRTAGDKIVLYWETDKSNALDYSIDGGVLTVTHRPAKANIDFFDFVSDPELVLSLPEGFSCDMKVSVSSGGAEILGAETGDLSLRADSGHAYIFDTKATGSVDISCDSGSVKVRNLEAAGSVDVSCGSGHLEMADVTCRKGDVTVEISSGGSEITGVSAPGGSFTAHNSSGTMNIEGVIASGSVTAHNSSGSINVENSSASEIFIDSGSGAVHIGGLDFSRALEIRSSSGGVKGSIPGTPDDYSYISADTGSGSCSLEDGPGGSPDGPYVDIKTGSGGIKVDYEG